MEGIDAIITMKKGIYLARFINPRNRDVKELELINPEGYKIGDSIVISWSFKDEFVQAI